MHDARAARFRNHDRREPYAASHGDAYCIRSLDVVDESPDFGAVLQKYDSDVHKPKAIYAGAR